MKKLIYSLSAILLIGSTVHAQYEFYSLQNSQQYYGGTARSSAMAGALSAFGGNLSAITVNPAGTGVYRGAEFNFTPVLKFNEYSTNFYYNALDNDREGVQSRLYDFDYKFKINQIGFVTGVTKNKDKGWVSTNLAFTYNNLADYNYNYVVDLVDVENTILDGIVMDFNDLNSPYYGDVHELAGLTGLVYYDDVLEEYWSYPSDEGGISQDTKRTYNTSGKLGEYTVAVGANYSHKLYVGGSIGIQVLRYKKSTTYNEIDYYDIVDEFHELMLKETDEYNGLGANLKLGVIYRPLDLLRIGAAFHSPTLFSIEEKYTLDMSSWFSPITNEGFDESIVPWISDYNLTTPMRLNGSLGIQFGKLGLLDVEYEYVDYSKMKLRSSNEGDSYNDLNDNIEKKYVEAHNLRFGGEVNVGPAVFRAGYGIYGTGNPETLDGVKIPYDERFTNIYSGGIGFRGKEVYLDFAYQYIASQTYGGFIGIQEWENKRYQSRFLATIGFRY